MRRPKGFSLIELLIVVAIILIIAAIAIPNLLRARISANEASAAESIRTIRTGEAAYFSAYPIVGYANQLSNLGAGGASPCAPAPAAACLIDDFLANAIPGTSGKSGYVFGATGINSGGLNSGFVAGAIPVTYGSTGNNLFCSTEDGVLRSTTVSGGLPTNEAACLAYPTTR